MCAVEVLEMIKSKSLIDIPNSQNFRLTYFSLSDLPFVIELSEKCSIHADGALYQQIKMHNLDVSSPNSPRGRLNMDINEYLKSAKF